MAAAGGGSERRVITQVLRKIDRQVRLNGVLEQLSIAVCLMLGALVLFELIEMLLPIALPPALGIVGVSAALFAMVLLWTQLQARPLALAAAVADRRGDLRDEMKSAYWFMRQDHRTPWIALQLDRAADTARGLDARRLVPTIVPQRFWVALGLFALLIAMSFVPLNGPLLAFPSGSGEDGALTAAQEDQFEEIRDLVEQAEALEETPDEGELLSSEARERLEEALRQLEAEELTMEELLRELRESQNTLEEGNLEMSAMQEALEEMARELEASPELADLAEAMKNQDLSEAAELMRQLAENLSKMQGDQAGDLMERLEQAAQGDQASLEELLEALQEAADAMSDDQMANAEQALQDAADAMEAMSQRMDAQDMMNQASQQMQAMQQSMSQQQLAQQMMAQQMMSSEQAGESQEGAMAMPSDEVQKTSGGGETGDPSDQEGGPAGHATSDPTGGEMELGAPTTLEVQLETEVLGEDPLEPEPEEIDPEDIFQEASRQQSSSVEYRDVRGPSSYAEGSALNVERIPWRYRNLVKRYFLAIRPRESK